MAPCGPWLQINHRRRGDADFGGDLLASAIITGRFARSQYGGSPERGKGIGIKRINQIMLGGNENHFPPGTLHHEI